jgi:hypothetical protein
MTNDLLATPFLITMLIWLAVVVGTGVLMTSLSRRAKRGVAWLVLGAIWICASAAVAALSFRLYRYWSVPPAAIAVGVSLLVVFAITARHTPAANSTAGLATGARISLAAVLGTILFPFTLLLSLVLLGIDGP